MQCATVLYWEPIYTLQRPNVIFLLDISKSAVAKMRDSSDGHCCFGKNWPLTDNSNLSLNFELAAGFFLRPKFGQKPHT